MPAQMMAGAGRHEAKANHQLPPPAPPPITTTSRALSFSSPPSPESRPIPRSSRRRRKRAGGMEAKKKSSSPTAAAGAGTGAGAVASPPNGYFSSVFSSPPAGNAKDAKQSDLYAMLNKQSSRGQNGSSITDSKFHGRTTYKDGKHVCQNESSESPYFGSSVHYGGREFYSSSAQKQPANEPPRNYKEDNLDGSATRGDWWQGSLYY